MLMFLSLIYAYVWNGGIPIVLHLSGLFCLSHRIVI